MSVSGMFPVDANSLDRSAISMEWLSPTARILLSVYYTFVLLFGLSGNVFVLYASLVRGALLLDRPSRVLVHVLAAVDILSNLLIFLPMLTTLLAAQWVLGHGICAIQGFFFIAPLQCEMLVILTASAYKMWMILKKSPTVSNTKPIHLTIIFNILLSLFLPVYLMSTAITDPGEMTVKFDAENILCVSSNFIPGRPYNTLTLYYIAIFTALPLFLIISLNFSIVVVVWVTRRKAGRGVPRQTVAVLSAVSWLFMLSYVPLLVMVVWTLVMGKNMPSWFQLFMMSFLGINVSCNPIVYAVSNRRFKRFVSDVIPFRKSRVSSHVNT